VSGQEDSVYDKKSRKSFIQWYLDQYEPLGLRRQALYRRRVKIAVKKKQMGTLAIPDPLGCLKFCKQDEAGPKKSQFSSVKYFKPPNAITNSTMHCLRNAINNEERSQDEVGKDAKLILERLTKIH
jgi:hypothetical protein